VSDHMAVRPAVPSRPHGAEARRAQNREAMHAAILEVAGALVAERGVDGLSIRELAKRLGYSAAAIYDYFSSREEILTWLYFEGASGLESQGATAVAALPGDASAVERLYALGHAYRAHALAHPELYGLVFGGLKQPPTGGNAERPEDQGGSFGTLVRIARQGLASGELRDQPLTAVTLACWSSVHGFVSLELTGHLTGSDGPGMAPPDDPAAGRARRDQLFRATLDNLVQGLISPAGRERLGDAVPGPAPATPAAAG
jgi:AcrR family transcriptional regulator